MLKINIFNLFPADYTYYDAGEKYSGIFLGTSGNAGFTSAILCMASNISFIMIFKSVGKRIILFIIAFILSTFVLMTLDVSAGKLGALAGMFMVFPFAFKFQKQIRKYIIFIELTILATFTVIVYLIDFSLLPLH